MGIDSSGSDADVFEGMIGRRVDRYRIVEALEEDGPSPRFRAQDALLGRTVALKLFPLERVESKEARPRFLREARAASQLHHPGLATVFDAGEADGFLFMASQLVEGETLAVRTALQPMPVAEVVGTGIAVAEALAHAHARGVIHRDTSSRNIVIDIAGHPMVVGFGRATIAGMSRFTGQSRVTGASFATGGGSEPTVAGHALGSVSGPVTTGLEMATGSGLLPIGLAEEGLAFVAPEVLRGAPADARSDIYGLGVVLYQALTGRLPHALAGVIRGPRPEARPVPPRQIRPEIPGNLDDAVLKAMAAEPEARWPTMDALAASLRACAGGGPFFPQSHPLESADGESSTRDESRPPKQAEVALLARENGQPSKQPEAMPLAREDGQPSEHAENCPQAPERVSSRSRSGSSVARTARSLFFESLSTFSDVSKREQGVAGVW